MCACRMAELDLAEVFSNKLKYFRTSFPRKPMPMLCSSHRHGPALFPTIILPSRHNMPALPWRLILRNPRHQRWHAHHRRHRLHSSGPTVLVPASMGRRDDEPPRNAPAPLPSSHERPGQRGGRFQRPCPPQRYWPASCEPDRAIMPASCTDRRRKSRHRRRRSTFWRIRLCRGWANTITSGSAKRRSSCAATATTRIQRGEGRNWPRKAGSGNCASVFVALPLGDGHVDRRRSGCVEDIGPRLCAGKEGGTAQVSTLTPSINSKVHCLHGFWITNCVCVNR